MKKKPNLLFIFGDQHRLQSVGYSGNSQVITPNLDRLSGESLDFRTCVAGMPVCTPYRASLMTGVYPLTHGAFQNDVCLYHNYKGPFIAEVFKDAGYDTAYIGKWHIDGFGRHSFIPKQRRLGFEYWKVLECTHDYNESYYYGNEDSKMRWQDYDAKAQTEDAVSYIKEHDDDNPFMMFLSFGTPHNPYQTAPSKYCELYKAEDIELRDNVTDEVREAAKTDIAGYYAHITAIDDYVGMIWNELKQKGIEDNTILIYTSDHGDMLGSQGQWRKQRPYDESILVPFLIHYPNMFGRKNMQIKIPINTPDLMPTILGMCGLNIPDAVEGVDYSGYLRGDEKLQVDAAKIECIQPFGEFVKNDVGREYRGIRTKRYTYVIALDGPWLLYDNDNDPYQLNNLINNDDFNKLQNELDGKLKDIMTKHGDEFLSGDKYAAEWGYIVEDDGTVPMSKPFDVIKYKDRKKPLYNYDNL